MIEGATHIDLYDRPHYVTPAVGKLKASFDRTLSDGDTKQSQVDSKGAHCVEAPPKA